MFALFRLSFPTLIGKISKLLNFQINISALAPFKPASDSNSKYLENIDNIETNFILRDKYIHKLKEYHIKEFENKLKPNSISNFNYLDFRYENQIIANNRKS